MLDDSEVEDSGGQEEWGARARAAMSCRPGPFASVENVMQVSQDLGERHIVIQ